MTEYTDTLKNMAASFLVRKNEDLDVDTEDMFRPIDWTQDEANDVYFARLIKGKLVTTREVTKRRNEERKRITLADALGENPATPRAFVAAWAGKTDIRVDWKGSMWIGGEFCQLTDLKRVMRMKALDLGLDYDRGDIDDAAEQLYYEAMAARPAAVHQMFAERRAFDWTQLVAFFRTDDQMTPELVVAVLQKFVHSARRKLLGKKVLHHLMPVMHGIQGCGKTYLIEKMVAPVAEATSWSNFEQITDDRNIALWNSLIIVLDEMARAAKADAETIKHVITSETLDRRPMRSNVTIPVLNRATMIGASNHRLDELIKDETGNRRFIELIFQRPDDRTLADRIDFSAMWASIQPDDADPLDAFRDQLAAVQRQYVVLGPVEDWLSADHIASGEYDTGTLYGHFLAYRQSVTATVDFQSRTQNAFASELRRVTDQNDAYGVAKVHTKRGNRWRVQRDRHLTVVGAA
jgi:hypothetical protein